MNREPTADAIGVHERASATPTHLERARQAALGAAPAWTSGELGLHAQQEWFLAVVMTPEGEPAPVNASSAARLVTPSSKLSSLERIEIYRRSYHARLVECLADDYPVLQETLGDETFDDLCRAYIARHPSTEPNLNTFGRHLPSFCREHALQHSAFASALGTLEWAIVLAIHAPTAKPLTPEELGRIPLERWAEAKLVPNPSLRILTLGYPVNAYFSARRRGATPEIPAPSEISVAVYRTERTIWRLELAPPMAALVESLARGEALAASLSVVEKLLDDIPEADAARMVTGWFRHAVSSGLFSAARVG
jgi:hypothetical protein